MQHPEDSGRSSSRPGCCSSGASERDDTRPLACVNSQWRGSEEPRPAAARPDPIAFAVRDGESDPGATGTSGRTPRRHDSDADARGRRAQARSRSSNRRKANNNAAPLYNTQ